MRARVAAIAAAVFALGAGADAAADAAPSAASRFRAGAWEVGVAGSLVADGGANVSLALRGARFVAARGALLALEGESGWRHVRELDALDVLASVQWLPRPDGSIVPFAGVLGGVRREWVGSFRQSRAPLGALAGVRVPAGASAALRAEYRILRLAGDPVADRTEHEIRLGVSILFAPDRP